jgi:uncharacterized protein YlxW (UPF0749 family)
MKLKKRFKYIITALLIVLFSLLSFIAGVIIGENNVETKMKIKDSIIKDLEKRVAQLSDELNENNTPQKSNYNLPSEVADYKNNTNSSKTIELTYQPPILKTAKPKLVIILDDVSFRYQVDEIKHLPFKITPSFFPPSGQSRGGFRQGRR